MLAGPAGLTSMRCFHAVAAPEALYHGGFHTGPQIRYAAIVSVESGPALERWIQSQLPE